MSASFSDSLAAEINSVSRSEVGCENMTYSSVILWYMKEVFFFFLNLCFVCFQLMEAVHKQEEINYRLQDYIDKIIVAIMESNPSILEVK